MEWAVHCEMRSEEGSFKEHLSMDLKDNDYDDIFHLFSVGTAGAVLNVNWREKSRGPKMRKKVKTQKFYRYFDKGCLEPFAGGRCRKLFPLATTTGASILGHCWTNISQRSSH